MTKREIVMLNGEEGWFDDAKATCYGPVDSGPMGRTKETIYKTPKGKFVLHSADFMGTTTGWREVGEEIAYTWLFQHGYGDDVPNENLPGEELE